MCLLEISKTLDMHLFLFDDILLLTRVKKASRKVGEVQWVARDAQRGTSSLGVPTLPGWTHPIVSKGVPVIEAALLSPLSKEERRMESCTHFRLVYVVSLSCCNCLYNFPLPVLSFRDGEESPPPPMQLLDPACRSPNFSSPLAGL